MKKQSEKILITNPGGTTTKIAIYHGDVAVVKETLRHSLEQMAQFDSVWDQMDMRRQDLEQWAEAHGHRMDSFDLFVSMCGLIAPADPGVYILDEEILEDMRTDKYGAHPLNPGCVLMYELGQEYDVPAITLDPSQTKEMMPIAYYSGHPLMPRKCAYHVLNQKATARMAAKELGREYEEVNLIVAHVGSGTTVGAHSNGVTLDVNMGIESDGPFSSVRTGTLPLYELIELCFSGEYSVRDVHNLASVKGGLAAYLGTSDGLEIEDRIQSGDEKAEEAVDAMNYQVAKEIGQRAVTLKGKIDGIVITGGLANWPRVVEGIGEWVEHLAPIFVFPGENELEALAAGALRYLRGEVEANKFEKG